MRDDISFLMCRGLLLVRSIDIPVYKMLGLALSASVALTAAGSAASFRGSVSDVEWTSFVTRYGKVQRCVRSSVKV
jgi:hypothetical protein